jgi:hypothetical protein
MAGGDVILAFFAGAPNHDRAWCVTAVCLPIRKVP